VDLALTFTLRELDRLMHNSDQLRRDDRTPAAGVVGSQRDRLFAVKTAFNGPLHLIEIRGKSYRLHESSLSDGS
jgi:hypothetical protein